MLALRWNLDKPFSMTEPPAEYQGFMKKKRLEALEIGGPGILLGAAVAALAAFANSDLEALIPTLKACAGLSAFSFLVPKVVSKFDQSDA